MCIAPLNIDPNTQVACRKCWLCRKNRIADLVGRCVAEQEHSDQAFSVTLTYAGDTPNAAVFCYRDVQLMLKRLKKKGHSVRYIVAGEYGSKRGRVHWHMVLFLRGKLLEIGPAGKRTNDWQVVLPRYTNDPEARIQWTPWSDAPGRGFVYFQQPDYQGFEYALKYALKDQKDAGSAKAFSLSKKPPLGYDYFMALADDLVERKMVIQLPTYAFRDIRDTKGKTRQFVLQGRMRELFLNRYRSMWRLVHKEPEPASEWYQEGFIDKIERQDAKIVTDEVFYTGHKRSENTQAMRVQHRDQQEADRLKDRPYWISGDGQSKEFREWLGPSAHDMHHFKHNGQMAVIFFDKGQWTIDLNDGKPKWHVKETLDQESLERQLLATGLKKQSLSQLCQWILWRAKHRENLRGIEKKLSLSPKQRQELKASGP